MITFFIISIGAGALLILSGFVCRKHPNYISGYDILNEKQKQIAPAITFKALVMGGVATIIGSFIAFLFNSINGIIAAMLLPSLIIPIYLVWKLRHTAKNPKTSGNGIFQKDIF